MQPCGNDWPGGWDCPMKISGHLIHVFPLKKPLFSPVCHGPPPPGGLLFSILAPKWAALTLTLCTQHCVPVSHLHVPHQNSTSTCFSTVFQVSSCLTHLLTARTVQVTQSYTYLKHHAITKDSSTSLLESQTYDSTKYHVQRQRHCTIDHTSRRQLTYTAL